MQEISNFIVDNWQWLITVAAGVVEFILLVIFRRTKLVDNSLLYQICWWIQQAEYKFKSGDDKKAYVIDRAKDYLKGDYSKHDVSALIEYVLSLPQKKGK